jgi:hypothetical protein
MLSKDEAPAPKVAYGEPEFASVHDPGKWSEFTFCPDFVKKKYVHHCLPTGCIPVPADANVKYKSGDWEFFYEGWFNDDGNDNNNKEEFCLGAKSGNMFPDDRKGILYATILAKLGLTAKRMNLNTETRMYLTYFLRSPIVHGTTTSPVT